MFFKTFYLIFTTNYSTIMIRDKKVKYYFDRNLQNKYAVDALVFHRKPYFAMHTKC